MEIAVIETASVAEAVPERIDSDAWNQQKIRSGALCVLRLGNSKFPLNQLLLRQPLAENHFFADCDRKVKFQSALLSAQSKDSRPNIGFASDRIEESDGLSRRPAQPICCGLTKFVIKFGPPV